MTVVGHNNRVDAMTGGMDNWNHVHRKPLVEVRDSLLSGQERTKEVRGLEDFVLRYEAHCINNDFFDRDNVRAREKRRPTDSLYRSGMHDKIFLS